VISRSERGVPDGDAALSHVRAPRRILVIGIGAGDPEHLTLRAVRAIGEADVFFLLDKGEAKESMIRLRREMLAAYARAGHRVAEAVDPDRDRRPSDYPEAVAAWRQRRAGITGDLIREHLAPGETGAFLVWGDPSLYDSTLGVLADLDPPVEVEVVPGISSVSALAARHGVGLNRVGGAVQVTTGRRLAQGWPDGADDVVVMLDARQAFAAVEAEGVEVYWGAYLGTPDELLVAGPLAEVAGEISRVRAEARARHGWIMDTYLLRRSTTPPPR
jgi:precorrin-6A synthase